MIAVFRERASLTLIWYPVAILSTFHYFKLSYSKLPKVCVLELVQLEDDLEVQYYFRIIFRALNLKPFFGSERIRVPFSCSKSNLNLRL